MARPGIVTDRLAKTRTIAWHAPAGTMTCVGASRPIVSLRVCGSAAEMLTTAEMLPEIQDEAARFAGGRDIERLDRLTDRLARLDAQIGAASGDERTRLLASREALIRDVDAAYDATVDALQLRLQVMMASVRVDARQAVQDALDLLARQAAPALTLLATAAARLEAADQDVGLSARRLLGERPA